MRTRKPLRRRPLRLLIWGASALVGLALVLFVTLTVFIRRPFPDYRGRVTVAGISAPVELFRDEYGVPHIYADTIEDLAYGQGYAHAQDRFWQMEFWRRIGAGRLAEILGDDLVETDRYLRTMGFARVAAEEYRRLPAPEKAWLESYAAGVNAYISSRPPGRLGLEFAVLGLTGVTWEIEPWTPVDTLSWAKIMAQDLSKNLGVELRNLTALVAGSRPLARAFDPPYPPSHPVIVAPDELASFRQQLGIGAVAGDRVGAEAGAPAGGDAADTRPQFDAVGPLASYRAVYRTGQNGVGSNSWVIGPELSDTGGALLANDMHLGIQMPSIWYEVGLHLTGGDLSLRGFSFPGVPGIIAGQNSDIAWGITNLGGDVQDLFVEQIDPENRDRYRDGGRWREMDVIVEPIAVQGREEPVRHLVRRTARGPVISDLGAYSAWTDVQIGTAPVRTAPGAGAAPDGATPGTAGTTGAGIERATVTALSLSWPALEPSTIVQAIYALNQARTYDQFRDALRLWDVPGQNLVYADRDGTIAYQATGRHPIRTSPHIGQLPARAAAGEQWTGEIPYDQLPGALNPEKGYIVTANNPVVDPDYEFLLGLNFSNGYRARRIAELIEATDGPVDADRIAEIHGDVVSLHAGEVLPYLQGITAEDAVAALEAWRSSVTSPGESSPADATELVASVLAILEEWDGDLSTESAGGAAFGFFWSSLIEATLVDEVPPWAWPPIRLNDSELVFLELLADPGNALWDDRTTEAREDRDAVLARALAAGSLAAARILGDDPASWEWGTVHTAEFRNATLGESGIGPVEALFNRGPFPAPGGPSTVNVAHWDLDAPFEITIVASERAIYDLADPSRTRLIHPTGQSGHPFHRHYDDYIQPWLNVEYHPANWTREEVVASAGRRRLILQPR